jgi:biotin synthase
MTFSFASRMQPMSSAVLDKPSPAAVTLGQLSTWYHWPLMDLLLAAQTLHRQHHPANQVQFCTLANIKSGNCAEDCGYCPQSVRYHTGVETTDLMPLDQLRAEAQAAKANGSTRFCMGAAWRQPPSQKAMDDVVAMVDVVKAEGLEACLTMGMLTADQAQQLKDAGLTAYNHNIDTSPNYYDQVISTRTIDDRLRTLKHVANVGLSVCSGGILGMGETIQHRLEFIHTLCQLDTPPESVPINCLVPVEGTPLQDQPPVDPIALVRTIATTRLALPTARVRLSAGRTSLSDEAHALAFMAGANSIFTGEKLLTTPNPGQNRDDALVEKLGMVVER